MLKVVSAIIFCFLLEEVWNFFSTEILIKMLNAEMYLYGKDSFKLYIGTDAGNNVENFTCVWSLFRLFLNLKYTWLGKALSNLV